LRYVFIDPIAACTLAALVIFVSFCFAPFHCFYKRARKELLIVLWHIFISPFGLVKFKHFFLADILTSFVQPLKDLGTITCFFATTRWFESEDPTQCAGLENYQIVIAFFPYWFRFAQCFVRYRETGLTPNLVNAGKYFSSICIQGAAAYKVKAKSDVASTITWSIVAIISTVYCLYWDYTMDWGLFKTK
jgi:hypothetical protein